MSIQEQPLELMSESSWHMLSKDLQRTMFRLLQEKAKSLAEVAEYWKERHEVLSRDADYLFEKLAEASGGEEKLREKRVTCQWQTFGSPKGCGELANTVLPRPSIFVCPAHRKRWEEEVQKAKEENQKAEEEEEERQVKKQKC